MHETITTIKMNMSVMLKHFLIPLCNLSSHLSSQTSHPPPWSAATTGRPSVTMISLYFLQFYINVIVRPVLAFVWHLLLSIIILWSSHVVPSVSSISFSGWLVFHCMDILPFAEGHWWFLSLAITNKDTMNTHVWVFVWTCGFHSFG